MPHAAGIFPSLFPAEPQCFAGKQQWEVCCGGTNSVGQSLELCDVLGDCEALTQRNKSPGAFGADIAACELHFPPWEPSGEGKERGETNDFIPGWFQLASPSLLPALPRDEDIVQQLITHRQAPSRQPMHRPQASSRRLKT